MESTIVGGRGLFRGFLMAGLYSFNSFSFFLCLYCLLACTPKILVQLLGNTVANKVFVVFVFCFLFLVFNGDQIEVSLFPFFFFLLFHYWGEKI